MYYFSIFIYLIRPAFGSYGIVTENYSLLSHIINTQSLLQCLCVYLSGWQCIILYVFLYLTRWMEMLVGRSLSTGTACYLCRVHTSCTTPYRSSNPCHTAQNSDENHSLVDINFYIDSLKCARCININSLKLWMSECLTTPQHEKQLEVVMNCRIDQFTFTWFVVSSLPTVIIFLLVNRSMHMMFSFLMCR